MSMFLIVSNYDLIKHIDKIEKHIEKLLSDAKKMDDVVEINELDYNLPQIAFGENPSLANASAALDLKFSTDKGRCVYTNENLKKGQVLFVERPFAFILLDNEYSNTVCAQCCQWKGDYPIP